MKKIKIPKKIRQFFKKLITWETYEDIIIRVLKFFIKRNPASPIYALTKIISPKFNFGVPRSSTSEKTFSKTFSEHCQYFSSHHPYISAGTSFVLIISIITGTFGFLFFRNTESTAAWWDDTWGYRKSIQISNSNGQDLTNFQVAVTIDTATLITEGKLQSGCQDLRFTDTNGNLLPYWIEENNPGCNNSATKVWLKIPTVYDGTNATTVYAYYGKSTASDQQNGDEVFEFFDDFNGNEIKQGWSQDSGTWNLEEFDNKKTISIDPGTVGNNYFRYDNYETPSSFVLETRNYSIQDGDTQGHPGLIFNATNSFNDQIYLRPHTPSNFQYAYCNNNSISMIELFTTGNYDWNTWTSHALKINGDSVDIFQNGSYKSTRNGLQYEENYHNIGLMTHSRGKHYFDWIFVRQYVSTDPTAGTPSSEEKSKGPVGHWSFDEGYGTTANDGSGKGNDGSFLSVPIWKNEESCVVGKCLSFDNIDDGVSIADNNFDNLENYTMSAWINIKGTHKHYTGTIMSSGNWNGVHWAFGIGQNNDLIKFNKPDGVTWYSKSYNFEENQWYYVSVSRFGTNLTYYVDGNVVGTSTIGSGSIVSDAINTTIGRETYAGGYFAFNGFIDEPKIYNYARTEEEIKQDYNAGLAAMSTPKGSSVAIGSESPAWMSDGLVGYWKMDESSWNGTANEVVDASGNGNHGTGAGGVTTGAGKFGNGGSFDGTKYISVADSGTSSLDLVGGWTIGAWTYINSSETNYGYVVGKRGTESNYNFRVGSTGSSWDCFFWRDGGWHGAWGKGTVHKDGWHYMSCVYDGENTIKIYEDGLEIGSANVGLPPPADNNNFVIGAFGGGSEGLDGKIDEARVYDRALSPEEVKGLYEYAPGPVLHLKMDEKSGTTAYDTSGRENHANSWGGDPVWESGRYGNALNFDNNDYVRNNDFNLGSDPVFTVSGWFKKTGDMNAKGAWGLGAGGVSQQTISGYSNQGENIGIDLWGTSTYYIDEEYPLNEWVYITWVKKDSNFNTNTIEIYVNGKKETLSVKRDGADTVNLLSGYTVGGIQPSSGYNAPVVVDDFKIYDYARTEKQIMEDMLGSDKSTSVGDKSGGEGSQVAYWKFDEGYGTTAYDSVGDNNGTISGASWTNDGKFGKALSFDGVDDYVNAGDDSSMDLEEDYTLSIWAYNDAGSSAYPTLLNKAGQSPSNGFFWIYTTGTNESSLNFQWSDGSNYHVEGFSSALEVNTWNHVLFRFINSTKSLELFVDGEKKGTTRTLTNSLPVDDGNLYIGTYGGQTSTAYVFDGKIDDFKIYNYALSENEIKKDYNQGKGLVMGSPGETPSGLTGQAADYCVPGDTATCNPPVAEWKFDDKSGTTVYDTSDNGNHGTMTNMEDSDWQTSDQCKKGRCMEFDGSNESISFNSINNDSVTVEGWFYRSETDSVSADAIFGGWLWNSDVQNMEGFDVRFYQGNPTRLDFPLATENGSGTKTYGNASYDLGSEQLNKWYHFTATYDSSSGSQVLYVDGVKKSSSTHTAGNTIVPLTTYSDMRIGYSRVNNGYFNGLIDNIKVYDYARTPAQIAWDYNRGKPIAHWKMDEGEGTTVHDESGNGNHGTMQNMSSDDWVDGKNNGALDFDGGDDYVDCGEVVSSGETTVALWFKSTDTGQHNSLIDFSELSSRAHFDFNHSGDGRPLLYLNNGNFRYFNSIASSYLDGNWHFLTLYIKGLNQDDILEAVLTIDGKTIPNSSTANSEPPVDWNRFYIGKSSYGSFNGQIDDVQIYNYALTDEQIKNIYNGGAINYK